MKKELNSDYEFQDYGTSAVNGADIFDINKGSNGYAQDILDDPEYMKNKKNIEMEIVQMSPKEYWRICARDVFKKPVEKLLYQWRTLDKETIDHLTQVILKYKKKFPITYIDYAQHDGPKQEGLHRMIVAGDQFGWDTKFPVMVMRWADKKLADEEKEDIRVRRIEDKLNRAIQKLSIYSYYNIEDLKDQLYYILERELEDEIEFANGNIDIEISSNDTDELFEICLNDKYYGELMYYQVTFTDADSDKIEDAGEATYADDIDVELDDIDLSELEKLLGY